MCELPCFIPLNWVPACIYVHGMCTQSVLESIISNHFLNKFCVVPDQLEVSCATSIARVLLYKCTCHNKKEAYIMICM